MTDFGDHERPTLPRLEHGSVFAGYWIDRLLDRGGMGVVYKAMDIDLDRAVALKLIAPEWMEDENATARFRTEARLAASPRASEHRAGPPRRRGAGRALSRHALRARDEPAPDDRSQPAPVRDDRRHPDPDRQRARRRALARTGAPRRQAGEHPDLRRDRADALLPDRLRADQASRVDGRADGNGPVGGDGGLRRPRADPGPRDRRARGHLLAGLRPVRDADRGGRLPQGRRHRQAMGAHQQPPAAAHRDARRSRSRLRRRRRQGDGQGSGRSLCDRGRDGDGGARRHRAPAAVAVRERLPPISLGGVAPGPRRPRARADPGPRRYRPRRSRGRRPRLRPPRRRRPLVPRCRRSPSPRMRRRSPSRRQPRHPRRRRPARRAAARRTALALRARRAQHRRDRARRTRSARRGRGPAPHLRRQGQELDRGDRGQQARPRRARRRQAHGRRSGRFR